MSYRIFFILFIGILEVTLLAESRYRYENSRSHGKRSKEYHDDSRERENRRYHHDRRYDWRRDRDRNSRYDSFAIPSSRQRSWYRTPSWNNTTVIYYDNENSVTTSGPCDKGTTFHHFGIHRVILQCFSEVPPSMTLYFLGRTKDGSFLQIGSCADKRFVPNPPEMCAVASHRQPFYYENKRSVGGVLISEDECRDLFKEAQNAEWNSFCM